MAWRSTEQLINEGNARAKAQNAASNYSGTKYMLNQMDPGGGYHSIEDPAWMAHSAAANLAGTGSLGKPAAKGDTAWSSSDPLSAFWSPTGTGWQQIDEGMLSNPDVAKTVLGAGMSGPSMGAWAGLKNKIPAGVRQGIEGSSSSIAPEILSKMWK